MSKYGSLLPRYYDSFLGGDHSLHTPLLGLLKKYVPKRGRLLELACGTGNILLQLPRHYELFGLDLSKEMLAIAKKKLPHVTLFHQNMSSFSVPYTFNVIVCLFDSINHLDSFKEWEKLFKQTAKHLEKGGIFIFDMNATSRLNILSKFPSLGREIQGDMVFFQTHKLAKEGRFDLRFSIFHRLLPRLYFKRTEHVYESTFEEDKVTASLKKLFEVKEVIQLQIEKTSPLSKRVLYVCQKK